MKHTGRGYEAGNENLRNPLEIEAVSFFLEKATELLSFALERNHLEASSELHVIRNRTAEPSMNHFRIAVKEKRSHLPNLAVFIETLDFSFLQQGVVGLCIFRGHVHETEGSIIDATAFKIHEITEALIGFGNRYETALVFEFD